MNEKELGLTPRVSVIVPVYNVAPYLRQCLDSIVGQTLHDIEIICVDDGSTDESPAILAEYALRDDRIRIITQPNFHVSAARNNGLAAAHGEYVIFWDSDDWFELDALEQLYGIASERNADLVICNAQDFDNVTGMDLAHNYLRKPYPETDVFCAGDCPDRIFDFSSMNCWNRLVRRSLLLDNDVGFPLGGMTEDSVVSVLELILAERIAICPKRLIHYRVNRLGSLMTDYASRADAMIRGCRVCEQQLEERGFLADMRIRRAFIDKVAGLYFYTLPLFGDFQQFSQYYEKMFRSNDSLLRQWDMSWETLPYAQQYLKAREMTPEQYLFEEYLEMTQTDKKQRARIRELEKQNHILKLKEKTLQRIQSSLPYRTARGIFRMLRAVKSLFSNKKEA